MQEFLHKRREIYAIQDQFPAELGHMDRIRCQIEQLEESFRSHHQTYDHLMEMLRHRFLEMESIQDRHPTVRVYTDMSQEGLDVAYGGVVVVDGELTTMTGRVRPVVEEVACSVTG